MVGDFECLSLKCDGWWVGVYDNIHWWVGVYDNIHIIHIQSIKSFTILKKKLKPNNLKIFSPFTRLNTSSSPLHHTFLTLCWWEGNVRRSLCKVIFKTSLFVSNEPMPKHILIAFCAVCTVYKQHASYCYPALLPFTSTCIPGYGNGCGYRVLIPGNGTCW